MPIDRLRTRLADAAAAPGRIRPFTTLAYAQSLDGSLAAEPGRPLRLSSEPAFEATHTMRALHDGILVGVDTVIADDPRLDVRFVAGPSPQPIVLDSRLRIPLESCLVRDRRPWIATTSGASRDKARALAALGAEVLIVDAEENGWVDLAALMLELRARGLASVMVEGGERTISSFLRGQLVDHLVLTIAPHMVGGLTLGRTGLPRDVIARLRDLKAVEVGEDLLLGGRIEFETVTPKVARDPASAFRPRRSAGPVEEHPHGISE